MRITGGENRGIQIQCPKGIIRPSMDRMRESVFSILGNINDLSFLDLFSGSGIIGLEACSLGANPIILVEKDYIKKQVLKNNANRISPDIKIIFAPVQSFIKKTKTKFDLIFLDPPFAFPKKAALIHLIDSKNILKSSGTVLIHHPGDDDLIEKIGDLSQSDKRKYGGSIVSFYQYDSEN